uniref:Uncharacterized protein AlNc14C101G6048 n=1 Tax=Albugo laibachii Nc14 TaxID=890382 RepID=F0WHI5_9STRA|nr:conserved hypothetical protein [Albugo laibachii Nc14]|eukprot:CCA20704.1 conserved hypothetical protein [Albugo laibachii Nc14]
MNALKPPAEPSNSEEEQDPLLKKRKLECEKEEPTALSPSKEEKDEALHASSPSKLIKKDETSGFAAYKKTNGFASFQNKAGFSAYTTDDTTNAFTEQAKQMESEKDERSSGAPTLTKVELANGEEDEQILQEQRGKLYKLVKSDYVEVGIGPVRILTKRDAVADRNNTRIVMRRESYPRGPGTKLILNARIKAFASVSVKTDRDLVFTILEPNEQKDELKEHSIHPVTYLLRFSAFENLEPFNQSLEQILNN